MAAGRKGPSAQAEGNPRGQCLGPGGKHEGGETSGTEMGLTGLSLVIPWCLQTMVLAFQYPRLSHPTKETDLAEMGGSQQALVHGEQAFVKDMFT